MVNKVILIGNVGADPDVKYLEGGVAVARFSLATAEVYNNKNGERVTQTEWHNINNGKKIAIGGSITATTQLTVSQTPSSSSPCSQRGACNVSKPFRITAPH